MGLRSRRVMTPRSNAPRADLIEVFGLHAAGRTRVIYETRPLANVNAAISEVLHGKAKSRLVLVP